ncbi:hypothetical protein JL100_010585 [Skermanella mucosa]|uniref:hypothetical protein n=1 Tax=Skermanella mucosa TaxID=1789672 RepID=UPI00192A9523|nr:hypothetical protein [Skermanella mucosa]UEM23158.1 hypothetical protein JL100_010585 [Skermanella mucosa]
MSLLRLPAAARVAAVLLLGSVQGVSAQQPVPPGSGSVASGITPARYSIPAPGKGRLTASVPPLPPKPLPSLDLPGDAAAPAAPMLPAVAKVTPYQPPIFWPPVPRRKPGGTVTAATSAAPAAALPPEPVPVPPAREGFTSVVPITVFGPDDMPAAPKATPEPTLEELAGTEPIVFTVRLPTVILREPAP